MFIKFLFLLDIKFHGSDEGSVSLDISYKSNVKFSLSFYHKWDRALVYMCVYAYVCVYFIYITNTRVIKHTLSLAENKGTSSPWVTGILLERFLSS